MSNQTKPADAYRGTRSACRECENARRREWYAARAVKPYQRPEMKAYYRQWYAANAESVKARAVEWTKANPDKRRDVCRGPRLVAPSMACRPCRRPSSALPAARAHRVACRPRDQAGPRCKSSGFRLV